MTLVPQAGRLHPPKKSDIRRIIVLPNPTNVGNLGDMARKSLPRLSPSEEAIMHTLWRSHPAGVLGLLEAVNAGRKEPITRNTLQTQLTRLEAKGWIKRDGSSRTHLYEPAIQETHGRTSVIAELKRRFFGGSSLALVRCLVENGDITADELGELRKMVRDSSTKKGARS